MAEPRSKGGFFGQCSALLSCDRLGGEDFDRYYRPRLGARKVNLVPALPRKLLQDLKVFERGVVPKAKRHDLSPLRGTTIREHDLTRDQSRTTAGAGFARIHAFVPLRPRFPAHGPV